MYNPNSRGGYNNYGFPRLNNQGNWNMARGTTNQFGSQLGGSQFGPNMSQGSNLHQIGKRK